MNVRQDMRASDHDRQQVVDVLRVGLEDGRLTMEEYTERMGRAYQAVTYADLAPLSAVLLNVVVWAVVCVTTARLIYPWPLWVAGPYGAVGRALIGAARGAAGADVTHVATPRRSLAGKVPLYTL